MSNGGDPKTQSSKVAKRGIRVFRWLLVLAIGLPSLWLIYKSQLEIQRLDTQEKKLQQKNEQILEQLTEANMRNAEVKRAANNAKLQREQISQIVRQYREADDFFEHKSALCILDVSDEGQTNDTLRLSLAKGNHFLDFDMERIDPATKLVIDKQDFVFPLGGSAGYVIKLAMPYEKGAKYRDPREMSIQITSSNQQFQPITKRLLRERVPPPSGASTGFFARRSLFFPMQYDRSDPDGVGVLVNRMTWSIRNLDGERFDLRFQFRLRSVAPTVIAANDMSSLWKKKSKYIGKGRYQLIPVEKKK